jgi:putative ABC transport system ATP-binding protein
MHPSATDQPAMIQLRDVHVTLTSSAGPVKILRGIDLDVEAGSSVSVVGPSGSGKSTLLAVIGGIERPTSGTVRVDGQDLGSLDEDALAAFRGQKIGILFQAFHLIPTMTALENVAVPLELAGARNAFEAAEERLAEVHLEHRAGHYPGQLSGGEQQRVGLARALSNHPKLLLADEPTGNLDQATGREIVELLFRLQEERAMTLLLITHEPHLAARCARQLRMADGRLHEPIVAGRPRRVSGADVA